MRLRRPVFLAPLLGLVLFQPANARADTQVVLAGAQLTMPGGWALHKQGEVTALLPPKTGAHLEVVHLPGIPAADPKAFAELLRARKGTEEVDVAKAAALEQHGVKGVAAEGTAKDRGVPVRVRVVAVPGGDHAVLVTAFINKDAGEQLQKEVASILQSVRGQPATPPSKEEPTADQFYLKVENLIDNVADLDVRRFTVLAPAGRPLNFLVGGKGVRSMGHRTPQDKENVRRLEAIVVLRLHGEAKNAKIRRLMKFHRTKGVAVEADLDATGRESLAGVVEVKVKPGRYPVGKPLVIGTVNGEDVVVTVE